MQEQRFFHDAQQTNVMVIVIVENEVMLNAIVVKTSRMVMLKMKSVLI